MSGRGVKRRRPAALVLDDDASDGTAAASTAASRLLTRHRRSSASTGGLEASVNAYGTRSRVPTADHSAAGTAGTASPSSSRSPHKREGETPHTAKRAVRGTRKRDLASQFAQEDEEMNDVVQPHQNQDKEEHEESAVVTQEMEEMWDRWNEEYFEIVEQLPLELHRSFALMRELEVKLQNRIKTIGRDTRAYRDARLALRAQSESTARARAIDTLPNSDGAMMDIDTPATTDPEAMSFEGKGKGRALDDVQPHLLDTPPPDVDSDATQPLTSKVTPRPMAQPPSRAQRLALLQNISRCVSDGVRAAEEKVGLAVTAYDWVDRHIRRLDADLQKSESSLLLGLRAGTEASRGVREALGMTEEEQQQRTHGDEEASTQGGTPVAAVFDFAAGSTQRRKGRKSTNKTPSAATGAGVRNTLPNDQVQAEQEAQQHEEAGLVPDMAIDPNEPKYCYCDQVSFGDMIACDNDDCPREWYHYNCVGLASVPRGRWYCLFCAPSGWKGPGGEVPPNARYAPPGHKNGSGANKGRR